MSIPGNLLTTAMAVMPHRDVGRALEVAFSMDVPFWPQLPHFSFNMVERLRGVHLCGNPDWDFLLGLDLNILSLDVYSNGEVFASYAESITRFLERGGVLVWGIVPTNFEPFEKENIDSLEKRLEEIWSVLGKKGIDFEFLLSRSLLSPATCCLVNPDGEKTVEEAFKMIKGLSSRLREKYQL